MLNALLIANRKSGAGKHLAGLNLPGRWLNDPAAVTVDDVLQADLIALFGGDGTMQMTLTQLLGNLPASQLPPVALLPFGTTNMNALALNRSRSRKAAVTGLQTAIRTEQLTTQTRALVRVDHGQNSAYGFFFGMGVIAQVVERWNTERKPGALTNQIRSLGAMVAGLSGVSSTTRITLDGKSHSVYGLLASTLDRLLFGSRPYWGDGKPGDLRVTWVDADAPSLLRHAPDLLRGRAHMAAVPGYHSVPAESAELAFEGPFILDGEIFHCDGQSLRISRSEPIRWLTL